ncbi:hypothetical protein KHA80_14140 [Anaerobacillus sp. HL2]|nr:hypothetical protein KHA80_14140 [Anaerobacillus sp. HL2]
MLSHLITGRLQPEGVSEFQPQQPVQQQQYQQPPVQQVPQQQAILTQHLFRISSTTSATTTTTIGTDISSKLYNGSISRSCYIIKVDAGKREALVQLLQSFGVQALTALPKEQYGAFATKLREMGAKI